MVLANDAISTEYSNSYGDSLTDVPICGDKMIWTQVDSLPSTIRTIWSKPNCVTVLSLFVACANYQIINHINSGYIVASWYNFSNNIIKLYIQSICCTYLNHRNANCITNSFLLHYHVFTSQQPLYKEQNGLLECTGFYTNFNCLICSFPNSNARKS